MEVSLMGRQAGSPATAEMLPMRIGIAGTRGCANRTLAGANRIGFGPARWRCRKTALRVVRSELNVKEKSSLPCRKAPVQGGPFRLFVGLPLNAVSESNTVNHAKAIAAGLRALHLLGADGVELPVWWGAAQPDQPDRFDWAGYLALARMVRDAGLRLRVSLHLHSSSDPRFPLPNWLLAAAATDPDLFFADRSGHRRQECLSFAADELEVLNGKTPLQAYEQVFASFKDSFAELLGSTITDISVGLGPNGELRYPSYPPLDACQRFSGVGEFQCHDKYMLANLKKHAEASGNPLWGLSGPHDAPEYNQSPDSGNFFKEHGGSWETPYGQFFLSWYSGQLTGHGDRMLSLANKVFGDLPVRLSAKVPLLHSWYKTRSHPSELTAGLFNTDGRDGYDAVAEMFARNSCTMILPGMDLSDRDQPLDSWSSPELLLAQIMRACKKHGVQVSGENSSIVGGATGFGRIRENLSANVDSFTYQRMGAELFSPDHWPLFMEFVRSLSQEKLDSDDLLSSSRTESLSMPMSSAAQGAVSDRQMQAV